MEVLWFIHQRWQTLNNGSTLVHPPKTKQWKHSGSSTKEGKDHSISFNGYMTSVFWGSDGILIDYFYKGVTKSLVPTMYYF
jgi:hypothetical protein